MRKFFIPLLALLFLLSAPRANAVVVVINTGVAGTPISSVGPVMLTALGSFKASRYAYLYTQSELAAVGITTGAVISSVGWMKSNAAPTTGGGVFKIYMRNSTAPDYSAATETWANLQLGTTLVYQNTNQLIPATASPTYIDFPLSPTFTYTGGSLEISVDWDVTAVAGNPGTGELLWMWSTVPDRIFGASNTTSASLATLSSTTSNTTINDERPFIQITYTLPVTTPPACVASPTAPSNAGTVCPGATTLSWPAVTTATSYDVYFNAGATATTLVSTSQAGTTYAATVAAGPYAWRIVPKNSAGSATGCGTFTFTSSPTVTPSVSIVANPSGPICAGTTVTFTATAVDGGSTPVYQWKKNGFNVGTNSNIYTDNALVTGDVVLCQVTGNAACTSTAPVPSNSYTTTVNPAIAPLVTITANPGTTILNGQNVTFTATPVNAGTVPVYQWKRNGLNVGINAPTFSSSTLVNGDIVWVNIQSAAPCPVPPTVNSNFLTIAAPPLPNDVSDPGALLSDVLVYPNPSSGTITVKGALNGKVPGEKLRLELQNLLGQVLHTVDISVEKSAFEQRIVLPQAANGIYLIQLKYGDRSATSRIAISR